jgi:hypothetical protein
MFGFASRSQNDQLSRVTRAAYGILLLTSVHHAYGAYIYATPWRLHVVGFAIAAAVLIGVSACVYRWYGGIARTLAFWMLCAVTLAFPFAMIGVFEGGYNHVLKDVLYFGGASRALMQTLFPAPAYELPNSVFFEVTGVAQLIPALLGARHLYKLALERLGQGPSAKITAATATHRGTLRSQ